MTIEELLKKYEPDNYELIKKPLIKEESKYTGIGCSGQYSNHYGIDVDYWNNVVNADELSEE
jgi:hypothetical protein